MNTAVSSFHPNLASSNVEAELGGREYATLDPRRLITIFQRHLRLFAAVAAATFLLVLFVTLTTSPRYTSTASVMLDVRPERVTKVEQVVGGLPPDTSVVDTQVALLQSRKLAERVFSSLRLDQDPDFNPALGRRSPLEVLKDSIAQLTGALPPQSRTSAASDERRRTAMIDRLSRGLEVRRDALTYVINISYKASSPTKAARIANAFAELYLQEQLEAKFDATRQASTWLSTKLNELRGQVQTAEAAVEQYKIANNLLSASGATLTEQEISTYNQQVAGARADVAEREARLAAARRALAAGGTGEDLGEALDSATIRELRKQRAEVSRHMADMESRYGPKHPEMLKAQLQLRDIDSQIQAETGRIIENLDSQAQIARQRAGSVAGSLGAARSTLASNNRATVRLRELERDADSVRVLYESYLNRFKELSSQSDNAQSDVRIVSRAEPPTGRSSPNTKLNLVLGAGLALFAGMASVALAELLDSGFTTSRDVMGRLRLRCLGSIPELRSVSDAWMPPIDFVLCKPLSGFTEAFRYLHASIQEALPTKSVGVVAITSALPGEGKTTTSLALGRVTAIQGRRTLLVDCDLRRRSLSKTLGLSPKIGLVEVVLESASIDDAIVLDKPSGMYVLPLSDQLPPETAVFGAAAMNSLLVELRRRFDVVVLDTPPVLALVDTRLLAPLVDAVVLLTRWRKTPQNAVENAIEQLNRPGVALAGVALSLVDMRQQGRFGYGDAGYYYGQYKGYYIS